MIIAARLRSHWINKASGILGALFLMAFTPAYATDNEDPQAFALWLEAFKEEARGQGISQQTLNEAFAELELMPSVIELDRKQPESTITLSQYLNRIVTDDRIEQGRMQLEENRALLEEIGNQYGVQPEFIVALWGIETLYGEHTGNYPLIDSLTTLAYDGRRSDFFRGELLNVLKIMDEDHMQSAMMTGSWAGAMGQCQFMPSSFLRFAVDYDQDGQRDIWFNLPDIFASIANYLSSSGWQAGESWGMEASLPEGFDKTLADIKQTKSFSQWRQLGVRLADGGALPDSNKQASLIMAGEGDDAVPYLIYDNYKVLLKWNRSRYFATAVGMLAEQIGQ